MKTVESFLKKANGVRDPRTGKTMVHVMWPATKKATHIHVPDVIPDGTLDNMRFWMYDSETAAVVICLQKGNGQFKFVDPRDLLKFWEKYIETLITFQIIADPIFETAAKEFTGMVTSIIRTKFWAGGLKDADIDYMEHD